VVIAIPVTVGFHSVSYEESLTVDPNLAKLQFKGWFLHT